MRTACSARVCGARRPCRCPAPPTPRPKRPPSPAGGPPQIAGARRRAGADGRRRGHLPLHVVDRLALRPRRAGRFAEAVADGRRPPGPAPSSTSAPRPGSSPHQRRTVFVPRRASTLPGAQAARAEAPDDIIVAPTVAASIVPAAAAAYRALGAATFALSLRLRTTRLAGRAPAPVLARWWRCRPRPSRRRS